MRPCSSSPGNSRHLPVACASRKGVRSSQSASHATSSSHPRYHPGGNPGANLKSISHRCHTILVACVWELTKKPSICPWVASRAASVSITCYELISPAVSKGFSHGIQLHAMRSHDKNLCTRVPRSLRSILFLNNLESCTKLVQLSI